MTIFITGGTSSIGRVYIKTLSCQGETMQVLVRKTSNCQGINLPGVRFVLGDVTDYQSVLEGMQGCSQVTHLAANAGYQLPEAEWWRVNREGSRNVLQAAWDLGVNSMVQVSSLSVLGDTEPGEMADETRPIDPARHVTLYQKTKFAADEIAHDFAGKGLPVKIVYPGFGFGCSFSSSHPSLQDQTLLRMAAGKRVAILGNGKNKLCLAYNNDTVEGIGLAHRNGVAGEGYILGNENLTFPEIWQTIARLLGKEPPNLHIPLSLLRVVSSLSATFRGQPIFGQDFLMMIGLNWCFSNQKACRLLGLKPKTFAAAISETWQAYLDQGWTPSSKS